MAARKMKRAVLAGAGKVVIEEVGRPRAGEREAVVRVHRAGICGSDIHAYYDRHPFITLPIVQGHEFSGTIAECGAAVEGLALGERVTVEPSLDCGECALCRSGRYNICENLRVVGCTADGAFAEYVKVRASKVAPLALGMGFEQGAMVEPVAVAVHAAQRARFERGMTALVAGAGTIGNLLAQVLVAGGAGKVVASDVAENRLGLVRKLAPCATIDAGVEDFRGALWHEIPGGPDLIFDCAGVEPSIRGAVAAARKGTRIVVAGVFEQDASVQLALVQDRELELVGTLMYRRRDFQEAMGLIARGAVQVVPLISHRFQLDEIAQAYELIERDRAGTLKVMITIA